MIFELLRKTSPLADVEEVQREREFILREFMRDQTVIIMDPDADKNKAALKGLVEHMLKERDGARSVGAWSDADEIRDVLVENGIQIKDSKDGTTWSLA